MTTNQLLYSLAHAIINTIDENVVLKEEVHKLIFIKDLLPNSKE